MKNPNRFGTCYKLSGKRRKPWIARAYTGKYGKYKTLGYFATKTEGQEALLKYQIQPYEFDPKSLTLRDVFDKVVEQKKSEIKKSSLENNYIRNFTRLAPIEHMSFKDLRPYHYQKIIDEIGKTMKRSSVQQTLSLISTLYEFAVLNDIVSVDYSKGIALRGVESDPQPFFTFSELKVIQESLGSVRDADLVYFLCVTGLRPTELLNIRKENIDLEAKIIRGVGIKTKAGETKRIPISNTVFPYIEERIKNCNEYLVETAEGKQRHITSFRSYVYKPAVLAMGLPYKSPKACRHTFANLTHNRLSDKARTTIIGHADSETTDKYYTNLEDEMLKNEYKKIDEFLTNF